MVERFTPPFPVYRCRSCSSSFRHPLPKNDGAFYDRDYYEGNAEFSYRDERQSFLYDRHVWKARLKTVLSHFRGYPPGELRFLDIGCAFGGFAATAGETCRSYGIDVSQFAVQNGNRFINSLQLKNHFQGLFHDSRGDIASALPEKEKSAGFDIITLIEVAEHLADPASYFQTVYRLLRPGGLCLIQTANMEAWQAIREGIGYHYYLPGHLTCYSARGLKEMLQGIGFRRFKEYIPVDFGLLPKLKKMRFRFRKAGDYRQWAPVFRYHLLSKLKWRSLPLTSSFVLYAFK